MTQGPLSPRHHLCVGGKLALAQAERRGMDLITAVEAYGGIDMVQQLMIDDELDEQAWHKGLIERRMDPDQRRVRQVGSEPNRARPRAATPTPPANLDRCAIWKKSRPHVVEDRVKVMMTAAVGSRGHSGVHYLPEKRAGRFSRNACTPSQWSSV